MFSSQIPRKLGKYILFMPQEIFFSQLLSSLVRVFSPDFTKEYVQHIYKYMQPYVVVFFLLHYFPPQRLHLHKQASKKCYPTVWQIHSVRFHFQKESHLSCCEWVKLFPKLIVSEVIEANISFQFLNLSHNGRIVVKTTETYVVNLKDGKRIPRRSTFRKCLTKAFRQNRKFSETIWKVWQQNDYRHSGIRYRMDTSKEWQR